jgi:hypothetical protein
MAGTRRRRHPLSGAQYEVGADGLVYVDRKGVSGVFDFEGRWISGELREADPHLCLWLGGPQSEGTLPRFQSVARTETT